MTSLSRRVDADRIPASIVSQALQGAGSIGLDLTPVLVSAGLDSLVGSRAQRDTGPITRSQFAPVWQKYSYALNSYVSVEDGRDAGVFDENDAWLQFHCVSNCKDLREVIDVQIRFFKVLGARAGKLSLDCGERTVTLAVHNGWNRKTAHSQLIEVMALACFHKLFAWLIGEPLPGLSIQLADERRVDEQVLRDIADAALKFAADQNAIRFDRSALRRPVIRTYRELVEVLDVMPFELMQIRPRERLATSLRTLVSNALSSGMPVPTLERAAALLGQSARSLRRHLAEEGESFQRILIQCRMQRAAELLPVETMSVNQVAAALGFSEYKTFARAFKKHTGFTPFAWRHRNRESAIP